MCDYPITVYTSTLNDYVVERTQLIADLGYTYQWTKLIKELKQNDHLINSCRLPVDASSSPKMYTPLHQAAFGKAPLKVFEELIKLGASKTLKTADGQTAYDIAKNKGLDEHVLKLIEIPQEISEKESVIKKMEQGLHKVILGRVENLMKKNGQQLPQLSFLYEFGSFYYPVPGMYGGFSVNRQDGDDGQNSGDDEAMSDEDNSQESTQKSQKEENTPESSDQQVSSDEQPKKNMLNSTEKETLKKGVVVESWCRVVGGSGQRHEIDEDGNWKLVDEGFV